MYETALRLEEEGGFTLISINRTTGEQYPYRVALEDELCLRLDENFPVNASRMIKLYAHLLDGDTEKRLVYLVNNLEDFRAQEAGLFLGIRLKSVLRKMPNGQTKAPDLFEPPWKAAVPNFRKAYWNHIHSNNPGLKNKEYAKMMHITPQHYQKLKLQFNKNALKANKHETTG